MCINNDRRIDQIIVSYAMHFMYAYLVVYLFVRANNHLSRQKEYTKTLELFNNPFPTVLFFTQLYFHHKMR